MSSRQSSNGPPDLGSALGLLAQDAPPLTGATAELAISRARSRRRRRWGVAVAAAASVAVAAPFVVSGLVADTSGPATPTAGAEPYDPTVGTPWPWLGELPMRLDEPLALALDGPDLEARVMSRSGVQWKVSDASDVPVISPDGFSVAWYARGDQVLVLRDLTTGRERRVDATADGGGPPLEIGLDARPRWSDDGRKLALIGYSGALSVIDLDPDVPVLEVDGPWGALAGWRGDSVISLAAASTEHDSAVLVTDLDGVQSVVRDLSEQSDDLGMYENSGRVSISPDGTTLALVDIDPADVDASPIRWRVAALDIASGALQAAGTTVCEGMPDVTWISAVEVTVCAARSDEHAPPRLVTLDLTSGLTRTALVLSPRLPYLGSVSVAAGIVQPDQLAVDLTLIGPAGRWWPGWYVDQIVYVTTAALLLAALWWILRRRHRGTTADDAPGAR